MSKGMEAIAERSVAPMSDTKVEAAMPDAAVKTARKTGRRFRVSAPTWKAGEYGWRYTFLSMWRAL